MGSGARPCVTTHKFLRLAPDLGDAAVAHPLAAGEERVSVGAFVVVEPNVRGKPAPTVGRQARAGENVPRTAGPGLVARRWGSA